MYKKIVFILLVIASFAKQSHAQNQWITSLPNPGAKFNWNVGDYLRLYELPANGTNYVGLKSPDARTTSLSLIFPTADPTAGQVLAFSAPSLNISTATWITPFTLTQMSVTSDALGLKLVNDATSPGNGFFYGTSGAGVKGWRKIKVKVAVDDLDANEVVFGEHSGTGVAQQSDSANYTNANKLGIGLPFGAYEARVTIQGFGTTVNDTTLALLDGLGAKRFWMVDDGTVTFRPDDNFRLNWNGAGLSVTTDAGDIVPWDITSSDVTFNYGSIFTQNDGVTPVNSPISAHMYLTFNGTDAGGLATGTNKIAGIVIHPTWDLSDAASTGNVIGLYYNSTVTALAGGNIEYFLYAEKGISHFTNRIELAPFGTSAGNTSAIRFYELLANGPHCIGIKSPDARADDITLVLPDNNPTAGQVMAFTAPASNISTGSWITPFSLTQMSVTSDASGLKLSGDASSPGNYYFYGTNISGTKGYNEVRYEQLNAPFHALFLYDDFFAGTTETGEIGNQNWSILNNGTGSGITIPSTTTAGRPGVIQISPGTTNTGNSTLLLGSTQMIFSGGQVIYQTSIRMQTLSTVGEEFICAIGIHDATTADATDGVYFEYDRLASGSDVWSIVSASNGTRTRIVTATAIASNTWYKLKIVVNAAGTEARFYVDDVEVSGTGYPITTNIPTTGARTSAPAYNIRKTAGTTGRDLDIDYSVMQQILTTAR